MIAGLILAAGESSRMGRDKALLTYRGRTFLETIIATLRAAGIERVVVVLGHHAEEIQCAVNLNDVEVVINPEYHRGQISSLQAGLRALCETRWERAVAAASPPPGAVSRSDDEDIAATESDGDLEAVVLCLVDHPALSADTVRKLIQTFRRSNSPVVIPTFKGQRGHPVLISRGLFPELLSLNPEQGANTVIRKYLKETLFVEVPDRGVLIDVDDSETYKRLEGEAR